MKKLLLILVIPLLIGAGCQSDSEKKDDTFAKKQECAKMQVEAQERADARTLLPSFVGEVKKIFYSPVKNSCLAYIWVMAVAGGNTEFYYIDDLFTKEEVFSRAYNEDTDESGVAWQQTQDEIRRLEGNN